MAIGWARSSWDAMAPFATGEVYVNFAGLGDKASRGAVFGRSTERLDRIRNAYDPDGLFAAADRPEPVAGERIGGSGLGTGHPGRHMQPDDERRACSAERTRRVAW